MKILKLLNNKYFSIIFILLIGIPVHAEDQPADIWNIEKKKIEEQSIEIEKETSENDIEIKENFESNIYNMQSEKKISTISLDENLDEQEIKIIGLYDPEDYNLDINMWSIQMVIN